MLLVVANLIYIFLVSRQLALLSTPSKYLHYFCGQMAVPDYSSEKFHLD